MKFKCKFNLPITILIAVLSVASLVGVITNVIMIFNNLYYPLKIVLHAILALCCIVIVVIGVMTILVYYYKIDNGLLIRRAGIFRETIDLSKVLYVCKYTDLNNIILYDEKSFALISINEYDFDKFVSAVREVNSNIQYEIKTVE